MPKIRPLAILALTVLAGVVVPFLVPDRLTIPVDRATPRDWNPKSFWFSPWGRSGVHKGIDIFASRGRPVVSASYGVVVFDGQMGIGGNAVAVLGPRWRIHYYAHLDRSVVGGLFMRPGSPIGAVGNTGNAAGKPPHLHYAILSLFPRPWSLVGGPQGWKRMFFVDPGRALAET